jgi:hypothetical protein
MDVNLVRADLTKADLKHYYSNIPSLNKIHDSLIKPRTTFLVDLGLWVEQSNITDNITNYKRIHRILNNVVTNIFGQIISEDTLNTEKVKCTFIPLIDTLNPSIKVLTDSIQ